MTTKKASMNNMANDGVVSGGMLFSLNCSLNYLLMFPHRNQGRCDL